MHHVETFRDIPIHLERILTDTDFDNFNPVDTNTDFVLKKKNIPIPIFYGFLPIYMLFDTDFATAQAHLRWVQICPS